MGKWLEIPVCLAAGTPIRTPEGSKPIEEIRRGDLVVSRDENDPTGPMQAKSVEEVFARAGLVWHLHLGGQVVRTTAEHPFYAAGKGWVNVNQLAIGDLLLAEDGGWLPVEDILDTGEWDAVYNFRVADYHTYFVGSGNWGWSVWAHNANRTCLVGSYDRAAARAGRELHHLLQQKAFINPTNNSAGPVVSVRGSTRILDSQHNVIHRVLEGFWEPFRRTRATPTNGEYLNALGRGLRSAGFTPKETYKLVGSARRFLTNRLNLSIDGFVPRVPGRFPLPFLPGGPIP